MNSSDQSMAYVARKPCGCLVAAAVDEPAHKKDTAKEISSWIRDGLIVERVTVEYVRENWKDCIHEKSTEQQPTLPGMEA